MSTFEEQYKKYKQKKQAEEKAKKQKISAFEQQYKRYRAQNVAEEITNRTNEWINSGGTLIDNYNARYKDGNDNMSPVWRGDAGDYYSSVSDAVNKQKSGAKEILDLIAKYGSNYDADWTKGIADTLAQNNSTYDQILKAAESDRDFWSQWESEEEYDYVKYLQEWQRVNSKAEELIKSSNGNIDKFTQAEIDRLVNEQQSIYDIMMQDKYAKYNAAHRYAENEKKIANLELQIEEEYKTNPLLKAANIAAEQVTTMIEAPGAETRYVRLNRELEELKAENDRLLEYADPQRYEEYKNLNWGTKTLNTALNVAQNLHYGAKKSVEDIVDYVNTAGAAIANRTSHTLADFGEKTGLMSEGMARGHRARANEKEAERIKNIQYNWSADNLLLGGKKHDYYYDKNLLSENTVANDMLTETSQGVGRLLPNVALAYATGGLSSSLASSGYASAAANLTKTIPILQKATFTLSAAGSGANEALEAGANSLQAAGYGAAVGALETATESLGGMMFGEAVDLGSTAVGRFLIKKGLDKYVSQGVGKYAYTFASEGLEEVLSDGATPILKAAFDIGDAQEKYFGPNWKQGWAEVAKGLPKTFAVGGLVGITMQGLQSGASALINSDKGGFKYNAISDQMSIIENAMKANQIVQASEKVTEIQKKAASEQLDKTFKESVGRISDYMKALTTEQRNSVFEEAPILAAFLDENGSMLGDLSSGFVNRKNSPGAEVQVAEYARILKIGEQGVRDLNNVVSSMGEGVDIGQAVQAYNAVYQAGKQGKDISEARNPHLNMLSAEQKEVAYNAGFMDSVTEKKSSDGVLQNSDDGGKININKESTNNEQGVHIREGGEWNDGENTQGQVSAVESRARQDQSRGEDSGRPRDREAASLTHGEEVSAKSLGIEGGLDSGKVYLIDDGNETASMRKAREQAEKRGLKTIFFVGGNLKIKQNGKIASARAYIEGDKVFVRVDHSDFTSDQLMCHEIGHDMIAKGEIDPHSVIERLGEIYTADEIQKIREQYAIAYEGSGMSAEEIWVEIICDSLGDMNVFATKQVGKSTGDFLSTLKSTTEADMNPARAPPAATEGKASREFFQYTEEQYNSFGWVRGNDVVNAGYWKDFTRKFSEVIDSSHPYPCPMTPNGAYIITVCDANLRDADAIVDTIIVSGGTIECPDVQSVIKVKKTKNIDEKVREVCEAERRGIFTKTSKFFKAYYRANFENKLNGRRGIVGSTNRHNNQFGVYRGRSSKKAGSSTTRYSAGVKQTFVDVAGYTRNVLGIGNGEYMVQGTHKNNYKFNSVDEAITAENENIIKRYANKYDKTVSWVKNMLADDPDFLKKERKKGKKFTSIELTNLDAFEDVDVDSSDDVQYSKGNSAEWDAERIKDGKAEKAKPISEIIEQIRHDFGINITKGHVRGKNSLGQYSKRNHGIRTKIANDLPTVSHELGHALDQRYQLTDKSRLTKEMRAELESALGGLKDAYKQNLWVSEGLAEYIRRFLQNRDDAARAYPEFTKYFINSLSNADRILMDTFADEINAYYALDGDTATSSIRLREEGLPDARTPLEKAREMGDDIYQAWVDANHGIKLFDEATGASTYKLASNAAYSDAIAGQIITGELTDANGQYVAPGLKAALEGVDIGNKKVYREFGEYLVVRHGPERLKEGMMIFADARKNTASFMAKRVAELEAAHPEFKEAADRLYEFQKQFLKTWAVDTGLIPAEIAEAWAKRWAYYVPLNRAVGKAGMIGAKRGYANQNSTIKKAIGSGLDIVHPVDNIINNIVKMVNAGVRNNVMLAITAQADKLGADATFLEKVPTPMKKKTADLTDVKAKLHDAFGAAGIGELLAEVEGENETEYSHHKSFSEQIDDVVSGTHNPVYDLYVGQTPSVLIHLGFDNKPLLMRNSKIKEILDKHSEMSIGLIKQIPDAVADPVMILKSKTNPTESVVVLTDIVTDKGHMIIPVWVSQDGTYLDVDVGKSITVKTNFVATAYGRNIKGLIEYALNNNEVLFYAEDKKRVSSLLATHGLQLPARLSTANSTISISQSDENVNKNFSTNSNGAKSGAWSQVDEIIESAIDDVLIQYGQGKAHGDVVTVLRNGKEEFWKINDALLLESLTNLSQKKVSGILEAYSVVSRFMTSNITGNNIIWSIFSNFPRDMMTFFTYSKNKNPLKAFASMGEAYLNKITDGIADTAHKAYIYEYYGLGGGQTSAYTADVDLAKRARKKLKHSSKLQSAAYYANPLNMLSFISETVESGPRIATYIMMREQGMSPQDAFYESQDITVNFKRGGRMSRELNRAVPFFNASVQGLDKFARWVTCADVPKAQRSKAIIGRATMYIAVSAALGALFYALNNSDDEDEDNYRLLSNYTKNSYWNIPLGDGKYFAIPKPREIAVLSTFIETTCEYFGGNDYAYNQFGEYVADNFLPPLLSDFVTDGFDGALGSLGIIGVASDLRANKDFLGRPIESTSLSGYESQDRYTRRTSQIAYWLGQAAAELGLNWSPVQIDYFFGQTLGGYWKVQKALFPVGSENVDWTLGVQNTYVKDNQYSNDIVNWMYDKADDSAKTAKSHPDDMDAAIDAKLDSNMKSFYSRYYALTKDQKEDSASRRAKRVVLDMIVEYRKATDNGDRSAAEKAVYEIVSVCKDTSLLPSVMQSTVKDSEKNEYKLTDIQYVEYQTTYNGLYWGFIEDNLDVNASDAEKVAIIKQAQSIAKERATEKALRNASAGSSGFFEKYSDVDDKDIITFKAQMDLADDDGSLKQPEVIDIIEAMVDNGLSKEDAYTLFKSKYPESDKNNPWRRYAP